MCTGVFSCRAIEVVRAYLHTYTHEHARQMSLAVSVSPCETVVSEPAGAYMRVNTYVHAREDTDAIADMCVVANGSALVSTPANDGTRVLITVNWNGIRRAERANDDIYTIISGYGLVDVLHHAPVDAWTQFDWDLPMCSWNPTVSTHVPALNRVFIGPNTLAMTQAQRRRFDDAVDVETGLIRGTSRAGVCAFIVNGDAPGDPTLEMRVLAVPVDAGAIIPCGMVATESILCAMYPTAGVGYRTRMVNLRKCHVSQWYMHGDGHPRPDVYVDADGSVVLCNHNTYDYVVDCRRGHAQMRACEWFRHTNGDHDVRITGGVNASFDAIKHGLNGPTVRELVECARKQPREYRDPHLRVDLLRTETAHRTNVFAIVDGVYTSVHTQRGL